MKSVTDVSPLSSLTDYHEIIHNSSFKLFKNNSDLNIFKPPAMLAFFSSYNSYSLKKIVQEF